MALEKKRKSILIADNSERTRVLNLVQQLSQPDNPAEEYEFDD